MSSEPGVPLPIAVGEEEFKKACGRFATGVAVATVFDAAGAPHGITVNSFSSVSLHPPLVLIAIGHGARILRHFRPGRRFGLNVLREDQVDLSLHFARKGRDGFEDVPCERGDSGVPLIPSALAAMECEVAQVVTAGDHEIILGLMLRGAVREGRPLLYFAGRYHRMDEPRV